MQFTEAETHMMSAFTMLLEGAAAGEKIESVATAVGAALGGFLVSAGVIDVGDAMAKISRLAVEVAESFNAAEEEDEDEI